MSNWLTHRTWHLDFGLWSEWAESPGWERLKFMYTVSKAASVFSLWSVGIVLGPCYCEWVPSHVWWLEFSHLLAGQNIYHVLWDLFSVVGVTLESWVSMMKPEKSVSFINVRHFRVIRWQCRWLLVCVYVKKAGIGFWSTLTLSSLRSISILE